MRDLWQTYVKEVAKYDWGTPEATAHAKKMTPGQNEQNERDPGEYDFEGEMAKIQLKAMIDQAKDLVDMFEDDENLPEWCQNKITKAADYIKDVYSYMEGLESDEDEEEDDEDGKD